MVRRNQPKVDFDQTGTIGSAISDLSELFRALSHLQDVGIILITLKTRVRLREKEPDRSQGLQTFWVFSRRFKPRCLSEPFLSFGVMELRLQRVEYDSRNLELDWFSFST